ncbi:MAG: hypothetical protein ABI288_05385 [Ginsengibacter sp.]
MQFNQILGQLPIKHKLINIVQKNRLPHSLLFLGKEGSGALPLAIAFSQYLLCEKVNGKSSNKNDNPLFDTKKTEDVTAYIEDSCGICASCIKINQLIHPDVHFSYPSLKRDSKHDRVLSTDYIAEWRQFVKLSPYNNVADWINFLKDNAKIESPINKQGNITVFECDDISHKLSLKAFESSYKILIMWMPEFLGNSGNKLLKLIEEPPADTLFIFVAEDESAILPTILSRTQLVKIPSLSKTDIEDGLITQYQFLPEKASRIAVLSEGNYREALRLLQNSEEDLQEKVREWLNVILKNNATVQVKWIEEISQIGREKQKQFLKYFIHLIEQALRVEYLKKENLDSIPDNERDFAIRLNKMCALEAREAMTNELSKAMYYIERNAHAKILFHALTIRLLHIIKDNSLVLVE